MLEMQRPVFPVVENIIIASAGNILVL